MTRGEDPPSQFLPAKGLNAGFSADDMVIRLSVDNLRSTKRSPSDLRHDERPVSELLELEDTSPEPEPRGCPFPETPPRCTLPAPISVACPKMLLR